MSKRKEYIKSCEISEVVSVSLGGFSQKIAIEGKQKNLPIVIVLHGGPGSPVPFSVGGRGLFPQLTNNAIMVYWDQLGCGINNHKLDDSFYIEHFVKMTCDLVDYIKNRFPQNKLYLFGISWGSILSLNAAIKIPEKLDGVIVYGQVLNNIYFNEEVLSAFSKAPQKTKKVLQQIFADGKNCKHEVLDKNLKMLYKLLSKHTNAYSNKNSKGLAIGKIALGLLTSPDYSFKDFKAIIKNGYAHNTTLFKELLNINLAPKLAEVKTKYMLLQGDTDIITSTANVIKVTKNCNNKNITLKILKNSGHIPSKAAMDECFQMLFDFIK